MIAFCSESGTGNRLGDAQMSSSNKASLGHLATRRCRQGGDGADLSKAVCLRRTGWNSALCLLREQQLCERRLRVKERGLFEVPRWRPYQQQWAPCEVPGGTTHGSKLSISFTFLQTEGSATLPSAELN